jgi:hypothetical protein
MFYVAANQAPSSVEEFLNEKGIFLEDLDAVSMIFVDCGDFRGLLFVTRDLRSEHVHRVLHFVQSREVGAESVIDVPPGAGNDTVDQVLSLWSGLIEFFLQLFREPLPKVPPHRRDDLPPQPCNDWPEDGKPCQLFQQGEGTEGRRS